MKVYTGKNKLLLVGKCWEVKRILKQYNSRYEYINQWINDCERLNSKK